MAEEKGKWQKVGTYGKCRSVWDEEGNFLRSEYRDIVRREATRPRPRAPAPALLPKHEAPKSAQPVRLAGGCTIHQLPGTVRL